MTSMQESPSPPSTGVVVVSPSSSIAGSKLLPTTMTTTTTTSVVPVEAIDPIVSKYIEFWFDRLPNEPSSLYENDKKGGETPLIEAARNDDEASIFMLLYYASRMTTSTTTTTSTRSTATSVHNASSSNNNNHRMIQINARRKGPYNQYTALHCAARNGNLSIVQMLLEYRGGKGGGGGERDRQANLTLRVGGRAPGGGYTPLMYASRAGHEAVTLLLLGGGGSNFDNIWNVDTMDQVISSAIGGRKETLVQRLVLHYLHQAKNIYRDAANTNKTNQKSTTTEVVQDLLGSMAVRLACGFFHLSTPHQESLICQLLNEGHADYRKARPTLLGNATLLAVAIHYHLKSVVQLLIEMGAHLPTAARTHKTGDTTSSSSSSGSVVMTVAADNLLCGGECNALHFASRNDWSNGIFVQLLLEDGQIHVNEPRTPKEWNITPLHIAATYGAVSNIPILLQHGAHINSQEQKYGNTPLQCAIVRFPFKEQIVTKVVEMLLQYGANVHHRNFHGQTALDMALEEEQQWIQTFGSSSNDVEDDGGGGGRPTLSRRLIQLLEMAGQQTSSSSSITTPASPIRNSLP